MSQPSFRDLTHDLRREVMRKTVLGDYQLRDGEWEERYRIETSRALTDGTTVLPRPMQQVTFEKRSRRSGRR